MMPSASGGMRMLGRARSWEHPAFEHLVGDGRGDLVDEGRAHLRIVAEHRDHLLLLRRFWLALRFPQLLAVGLLVFLDDLARHHVDDRILSARDTCHDQREGNGQTDETLVHCCFLSGFGWSKRGGECRTFPSFLSQVPSSSLMYGDAPTIEAPAAR